MFALIICLRVDVYFRHMLLFQADVDDNNHSNSFAF